MRASVARLGRPVHPRRAAPPTVTVVIRDIPSIVLSHSTEHSRPPPDSGQPPSPPPRLLQRSRGRPAGPRAVPPTHSRDTRASGVDLGRFVACTCSERPAVWRRAAILRLEWIVKLKFHHLRHWRRVQSLSLSRHRCVNASVVPAVLRRRASAVRAYLRAMPARAWIGPAKTACPRARWSVRAEWAAHYDVIIPLPLWSSLNKPCCFW